MIGSQLVENTWSFKPIACEESVIFFIIIHIEIGTKAQIALQTKPKIRPPKMFENLKPQTEVLKNVIQFLVRTTRIQK